MRSKGLQLEGLLARNTYADSAKRLVETLGSFDSCFDGFLQKAQKKKESYLDQTFRMRGSRRRLKFNSRSTVAAVGFIPRESSPTMRAKSTSQLARRFSRIKCFRSLTSSPYFQENRSDDRH